MNTVRKTVLVTGASGFAGVALVPMLANQGWNVRVAVRNAAMTIGGANEHVVVGDHDADTDWRTAVEGVDAIAHVAGRAHVLDEQDSDPIAAFRRVNRDGTLNLARQAASAGVRRLLFVSTIGVNGNATHGVPFTAAMPAAPHSPYAVSKWEAEQGLHQIASETSLEICVVRPPLVVGPEPKGNLATLINAMRRGLPLPLGSVTTNRRDLVSRETLCDLIGVAVNHPAAAGQTFLVCDGQPLSTRALMGALGRLSGVKPRLVPFPAPLLAFGLRMLGKASLASQLCGDLEIDMTATCDRLGWSPPALSA